MAQRDNKQALMQANIKTVNTLLEKHKSQIMAALPKHMNADRMARLALTLLRTNNKLAECDPLSLMGAIVQCAQWGLEPDQRGLVYLVPFWNSKRGQYEVQVIPGYKGLMDLARRGGEVVKIEAHVVREGDLFDYQYGTDEYLRHIPSRDRGGLIGAYAIATYKDGAKQFEVVWQPDIDRAKLASKASDRGPWVDHPEPMWMKTAVRRLSAYLPLNPELSGAVAADDAADTGKSQQLGAVITGEFTVDPDDEGGDDSGGDTGPGDPGGNGSEPPRTRTDEVEQRMAGKAAAKGGKAQGDAPTAERLSLERVMELMDNSGSQDELDLAMDMGRSGLTAAETKLAKAKYDQRSAELGGDA